MHNDTSERGLPVSRRDLLLGLAAGGGLVSAPALARGAAHSAAGGRTIVHGVVFEDIDGTGVRRESSMGIPGVMVSNGRDVVLTAVDGRWSLPVDDGDSVFVIKPAHWSLPIGEGIPAFHHLHQPGGTPARLGLRFAGVPANGALPRSIDFSLRRCTEAERFEAALVADTQPGDTHELGYVRDDTLATVQALKPAFAISHGDVMGDDLSLFPRYRAMLGATGTPWHHCPGNHDMNLDSPSQRYAFETWKREIGPTHYAFQHAGATFILLNNVFYYGAGKAPRGQRGYRGLIGERQLRFVENVLRHTPREHLVVVSMHIPLVSFEDPASPADNTADRRRLLEILSRHPRTVSFSGHSHTTEHHYFGNDTGFSGPAPHHHHVLTAACGSWWSGPMDHRGIPISDSRDGSPRGLHILTVDGSAYATRFVPTGQPAGRQMRITVSSRGCVDPTVAFPAASVGAPTQVTVDVFDGGPQTHVTLELEGLGLGPLKMVRTAAPDPYVVDMFSRHADLLKPWVKPAISSHVWSAALPCGIGPGAYRLVARARDQYGREHVGRHTLEITA